MNNVAVVANQVLVSAPLGSLSNLAVQGLTFISYGFNLAMEDKPLFYNEIVAARYGPIIPDLRTSLARYGNGRVNEYISSPYRNHLLDSEIAIIGRVVAAYGKYSDLVLSTILHSEGTPWEATISYGKEFALIPDYRIKEYYTALLNRVRSKTEKQREDDNIVASFLIKTWRI